MWNRRIWLNFTLSMIIVHFFSLFEIFWSDRSFALALTITPLWFVKQVILHIVPHNENANLNFKWTPTVRDWKSKKKFQSPFIPPHKNKIYSKKGFNCGVPSKHKTFVHHLTNVGPTSSTVDQHCTNVIQMFCVCWGGYSWELRTKVRILVQVTIYRRLLIGRDGHLDQSEAYDIS